MKFLKKKAVSKLLYIFFDVDGVLNKESDWKKPFTINSSCMKNFAKSCNKVRNKKEIRLIIISSWRRSIAKNSSDNPGLNGLKELGRAFGKENLTIYGSTPLTENKSRQEEIVYYIKKNNVQDFIIIDDDLSLYDNSSGLPIISPNFKNGFTAKNGKDLIRIARRPWSTTTHLKERGLRLPCSS